MREKAALPVITVSQERVIIFTYIPVGLVLLFVMKLHELINHLMLNPCQIKESNGLKQNHFIYNLIQILNYCHGRSTRSV